MTWRKLNQKLHLDIFATEGRYNIELEPFILGAYLVLHILLEGGRNLV